LPPAIANALEPKVERVISLELGDVVPQIPAGFTKPIEVLDPSSRILLKASEVEKGMANGRPTVSLASIQQQIPEIFLRTLNPGDTTQVSLPFGKVLDEFTKLQVRSDQVRQPAVPQVVTPFLQVTLEDDERFGTTTENLETADLPPVKVEPPTAEAFAAAEPEPIAEMKPAAPPAAPAKTPISIAQPPAPTRIPFKLSPNGTDVPATESVPASGGPSVPTLSPAESAPARIPFKLDPASDGPSQAEPSSAAPAKTEVKIHLGLKTVLQALPAFQLAGDADSVPSDVRLELPFSVVEPQLATGRVNVAPDLFAAGIPETYRLLFKADCAAEVSLPLQEVLKNLPATSLRMRDDQVEQEVGANFETPFSTTAEEDAKRLGVSNAPIAKPLPVAAERTRPEPQVVKLPSPFAPAAPPDRPMRTPLQVALDTDEKLDAKDVVSHINRMPGVKASAIVFGDGLSLAGKLPPELEAEGLCAMAPALMQRLDTHMAETKLGALRGLTVNGAKGAVTFFNHENLCLAALHSNGEIASEVRDRLSRVVHELSRKYSEPI
jgi:predicted regulator of Ras-like GTPase activity (Roadblock/LC7/MglB family)